MPERLRSSLPPMVFRATAISLVVLSLGCGGARPRATEAAAVEPEGERASVTDAAAGPSAPTGPITVSSDVTIAPAPSCPTPPTACTDAAPCPVRAVALELDASACTGPAQVEDVALVTFVRGLVVAGDRAWIDTDQGMLGSTSSGWEPDLDARRFDSSVRLVFGHDVWRMPRAIALTECHQPVVHCRGGRPKCAAPMPVCVPVADLVLATHGPHDTPLTMPSPLAAGRGGGGMPEQELLVAMAGTSAHDVWVLSAARLFHWDGHAVTAVTLDADDPIVQLVSDPSGVHAATRGGRRLHAVEGAWQPLPDQPGPFLGQVVEAPPHPFVVLDEARATGADSFWARGRLRAFGDRYDLAPAVVRYEHGTYRTWIGAVSQRTWLRAGTVALDAMRPEVFDVLVEDAAYATPVFPFVEVRWQEPRDLVRLASEELLVAGPLGVFGLSGARWTRYVGTSIDALAASGDLVGGLGDGTLQLREAGGWCPAMRPPVHGGETLAIAHGRAWVATAGRLFAVDASHATEEWMLRIAGSDAHVERLLGDGLDVMAFVRTPDGHAFATRFDGTAWSPATPIGSDPVYSAVGSSATGIRTSSARFDGRCWSTVTSRPQPLVEVPAGAGVEIALVGDEEAEVVVRIVPAP